MSKIGIKKVIVLGSGALKIGQAGEFDYSGSQALKALKEEGISTVLLNPNIATIQTSEGVADKVYFLPITPYFVEEVIKKEQPDGILLAFGGQTALNCGTQLYTSGTLAKYGVKVLGTSVEAIMYTEDRDLFVKKLNEIDVKTPISQAVETMEDAVKAAYKIGFPVMIRSAYALGGMGSGICKDEAELRTLAESAFAYSSQILVEESLKGWKEIEFEVIRDKNDHCFTVVSMENVDPLGVHTGESIVVAPTCSLTDKELDLLKELSTKTIRHLGIVGECNIQYAFNSDTCDYRVIEVSASLSRSSALASKATGYPIAKVAAKIAIGYTLDEIKNAITGQTMTGFEPTLDYCVVKMPRLPFDKFISARRTLTTQMKATGEVMSISDSFEGALMKAIRSLEQHVDSLMSYDFSSLDREGLLKQLAVADDRRIWVIAEALRQGISYEEIHAATKIDVWFIDKLSVLVEMEQALRSRELTAELLKEAKRLEFPDSVIARLTGRSEADIKHMRCANGIVAAYRMVDTCAAEFAAATPYYYSVFGGENEAVSTGGRKKVLVLGSGPIRIGQGIEFDFCSVHCTWAFAGEGYETIIVNNNPETVSTDFDIADKLYFEPLTPEDVENIVRLEKPDGAVVQFGGQTAIKLTEALMKMGVPILGTSAENVDAAEDRELFDGILEKCGIPRPKGDTVYTAGEAKAAANRLGYPVLVRPSYVLGGQGMQIAINDKDVEEFIGIINRIAQDHPILVDKYLQGKEIEVDAVCDGEDILIPGIMEHIERAGIHSGDSISVYPAQSISAGVKAAVEEYTKRLARSLHVVGLINIQFIAVDEKVYVIEVNPRSSRTVPYISKVTGIPIVPLATKVILGQKIRDLGYTPGLQKEADYFAVKMPVFSFEKIRGADISLGPEMKSTGECLGIAKTFNEALYKAFLGAGIRLPKYKNMIITVRDEDKEEAVEIAKRFEALGYHIFATKGTARTLMEADIQVRMTRKLEQESPNILDLILGHQIDLVIDTPSQGVERSHDGFVIRRNAVETGVNVLTAIDTAKALVTSLENMDREELTLIDIARLS